MKPIEEIKKSISALCRDAHYPGSSNLGDFNIEISNTTHRGFPALLIAVTEMYEKPFPEKFEGNMLKFYAAMQKAIGCKALDLADEIAQAGCESCDHGSQYGWEFLAWDEDLEAA